MESDQEQLEVQKVVSDLDSKLNEFIGSVPDHRTSPLPPLTKQKKN